ncbi:hypothetical protein [Pseudomarimonas salicorniae]|uniref:Uncharacterized protein n=1 Tax=Pseudomarimonas salicorniae TaxID=2933270 RepID=A0ABT0GDV2_9GAMM|nr:hypothetical protein [Lysobacter sp. CAU 1642]MCK7592711.1 hypothetical protein [Lysobacter sp. CAU 1642]
MSEERGEILALLREIRDGQQASLALQREQFELYRQQWARAERINERAEALQQRQQGALGMARGLLIGVGAALLAAVGLLAWRLLG